MYRRKSRISLKLQKDLLGDFAAGIQAAKIIKKFKQRKEVDQKAKGLNQHTVYRYYNYFRECIFAHYRQVPRFSGEVEIDEATFGGPSRKKKKYHNADIDPDYYQTQGERKVKIRKYKKIPKFIVMGLLNRGGDVFSKIVLDRSENTLLSVIHMVVEPGTTIFTDEWSSYSKLGINREVDEKIIFKRKMIGKLEKRKDKGLEAKIEELKKEVEGLEKEKYTHIKINHSKKFANRKGEHVNTLESFWGFTKNIIREYKGGFRHNFPLHLKEAEFRRNVGSKNILKELKKIVKLG